LVYLPGDIARDPRILLDRDDHRLIARRQRQRHQVRVRRTARIRLSRESGPALVR
jgi:hypothetical protein